MIKKASLALYWLKAPYWFLAVYLLSLSACITQPRLPVTDDAWQLSGRVSVRTQDLTETLSIKWRQSGDEFDIRFTAALGISIARIHGNDQSVTLETDDGIFQAASAEQLLAQRTGLRLPLASLVYWLHGKPAPDASYEWQEQILSQSGWQISYKRFERKQAPKGRPTRLKLKHPDVDLNLAITRWD